MVARPSVLLVDADPRVRRGLVRALQTVTCVTDVGSAAAAMSALYTGTVFDVIVADVTMPEMSGIELFDTLCATDPALAARFIAVTGDPSRLAEDFRNAIGDRVMLKPVALDELRQLVLAVAGTLDIAAE